MIFYLSQIPEKHRNCHHSKI